ncbi:hypothetical protein TNCV_2751561 [Trichonephila clavipes]|nr:hypothetical protein TNCV_2751561 [Trichonephila clavipes]
MPLSRMLNSTFAMPNIIDSHDMGLRTVLQSRRPKPSSSKSSRDVGGRGREVGVSWPPQGFHPLNRGGTEQNPILTCMMLKAKTNDRRKNSCS